MNTRRMNPSKLGGGFHGSIIGSKAPSAVEAHRWNPHIIPVGVLFVGRWVLLPFRRSDELLVFQDADGEFDVRVVRPIERRNRLSTEVIRQPAARFKGEDDPVDCPESPFCLARNSGKPSRSSGCTQLNNELLRQIGKSDVKLAGDVTDNRLGPRSRVAMWKSISCKFRDRSHSVFITDDIFTVGRLRYTDSQDCFHLVGSG